MLGVPSKCLVKDAKMAYPAFKYVVDASYDVKDAHEGDHASNHANIPREM
jgi:hypothetical protein